MQSAHCPSWVLTPTASTIWEYSPSEKTASSRSFSDCLTDEFGLRSVGFDNTCSALLTHILIDLSRGADKITAGPTRKLSSIAYLHSHYKENTDMAALAEMEHLSVSRYREVFRRHTGFSPTEYRTILRLRHACDLLASTDMPVSQIAGECGYNDPLYFFRIFKTKEKITPTEYKARSAAENLYR